MSFPELLFAAVVLFVGIPAAFRLAPSGFRHGYLLHVRNLTALALVGAYAYVTAVYWITAVPLAVGHLVMIDMAVIAAMFCKLPAHSQYPYRDWRHQLAAFVTEKTLWDRLVLAIFPLVWAVYAFAPSAHSTWWALYWLSLAQFLAAGGEAYQQWREAKARMTPDTPSSGTVQFTAMVPVHGGGDYG